MDPCDCCRDDWEEFVRCQVRVNETYSDSKNQFSSAAGEKRSRKERLVSASLLSFFLALSQPFLSVRNRDVIMNAQSPHEWCYTLKPAVFSSSLSQPSLLGGVVDWCARLVHLLAVR